MLKRPGSRSSSRRRWAERHSGSGAPHQGIGAAEVAWILLIAATLPKDMADRLKLADGDPVIAIETERGILLTPYDRDTEEALSLAAAYGYGLTRNHPYNDGNKRVAFVVMAVFLGLNGLDITASEADVVTTIVALAAGKIDEETLADWLRLHTGKRKPESR